MPRQRGSSPARLLALALASAAGLLAAGLATVIRSARIASEQARGEADRSALFAAQAVSDGLRDRTLLAAQPPELQFRIAGGELQVPAEVGWFESPPVETPELEVPWPALRALEEAERAGAEKDAASVAAAEQRVVELAASATSRSRDWLRVALAWNAEHRGDAASRDAHLAALTLETEPFLDVVAGALLLSQRAQPAMPIASWMAAGFARVPESRARAIVSRLEETGADRKVVSQLVAITDRFARWRSTLRAAATRQSELSKSSQGHLEEVGREALLAYAPEQDGVAGDGIGAVWPIELVGGVAEEILRQVDRAPLVVRTGEAAGALAARVSPHVAIEPRRAGAEPGWLERFGVVLLLGGLMLACASGLLLALRALRRESLATRARAEFLTLVTHELKTPLASIRLFAEMLDEGRVASDAKRAEYHRLLAGEAERLSTLIENVLDLGRLERGERAFDRRPQRVDEIVRDVVERFRPLAERDGIEVEMRMSDEPRLAALDRGALAQALLNLLENARKYAREGRRVVVSIEPARPGGAIRIGVRDFGPGVPAADREVVFERFRRGERERDGSVPGLGLGLHIARSLVRVFGGDVSCETPQDGGAGASFVIALPETGLTALESDRRGVAGRAPRAVKAEIPA